MAQQWAQEVVGDMKRLEGRVAFVTGAARGQGRAHAIRLAGEGADVIAVDVCRPVAGALPTATPADLAETVRAVEGLGRRIVAAEVDVRDLQALAAAVDDGVAELGRLDVVVANAGIALERVGHAVDADEDEWQAVIDINLTGVWHTCKVATPHLQEGASIVIVSSAVGIRGRPNIASYVAAKHGAVGLMRSLAYELGPRMIRVNCVNPGMVDTSMIQNDMVRRLFRPDLEEPTREDFAPVSAERNLMPVPWVDPVDVSNAVVFLASDESRYVTGILLPVDAGMVEK